MKSKQKFILKSFSENYFENKRKTVLLQNYFILHISSFGFPPRLTTRYCRHVLTPYLHTTDLGTYHVIYSLQEP